MSDTRSCPDCGAPNGSIEVHGSRDCVEVFRQHILELNEALSDAQRALLATHRTLVEMANVHAAVEERSEAMRKKLREAFLRMKVEMGRHERDPKFIMGDCWDIACAALVEGGKNV